MATAVALSTPAKPVVCLGYGTDIHKSSDRRNLTSSSSQNVAQWKDTISALSKQRNLLYQLENLDCLLSESGTFVESASMHMKR